MRHEANGLRHVDCIVVGLHDVQLLRYTVRDDLVEYETSDVDPRDFFRVLVHCGQDEGEDDGAYLVPAQFYSLSEAEHVDRLVEGTVRVVVSREFLDQLSFEGHAQRVADVAETEKRVLVAAQGVVDVVVVLRDQGDFFHFALFVLLHR